MPNHIFSKLSNRYEEKSKDISLKFRKCPYRFKPKSKEKVYNHIFSITLTTKSPFDHFKGFFELIGKNNKKIGSL